MTAKRTGLKCDLPMFALVASGAKTFELRAEDGAERFETGDQLVLWSWDRDRLQYGGHALNVEIGSVHRGIGIAPGYAVFSLARVAEGVSGHEVACWDGMGSEVHPRRSKMHTAEVPSRDFEEVASRQRRFLVLRDAGGYRFGNRLLVWEAGQTGRGFAAWVGYVLREYPGLEAGHVIASIVGVSRLAE